MLKSGFKKPNEEILQSIYFSLNHALKIKGRKEKWVSTKEAKRFKHLNQNELKKEQNTLGKVEIFNSRLSFFQFFSGGFCFFWPW